MRRNDLRPMMTFWCGKTRLFVAARLIALALLRSG
jgi:hypothetical protein